MEICKKLSRDLAMFTYIYFNIDKRLTSSMLQQRFKLQMLLNYTLNPENAISED